VSRTASPSHILRRLFLAGTIALLLLGGLARPPVARAASYTFNVNSNEWYQDIGTGDGICLTGEGNCTLRAAIQEAYALGAASGGTDTITINLELNTYPLQGTLNPGNATVIINGNGSTLTGKFGGVVGSYRLFQNSAFGGHWYFSNLTMQESDGGGIYVLGSGGSLTVNGCTFRDLHATTTPGSTGGGAITTGGTVELSVLGSTFQNNSANANGGAISHGHAPLTISNSTFSGNAAPSGDGGGLYAVSASGSEASLTNVNFRNNTAANGGGLFASQLVLEMTGGEVTGNSATSEGGGIALQFTRTGTTISEVRIANNSAGSFGGGLVVDSTALSPRLEKSTVIGNTASTGGGIMLHGARLDIEQSAIVDNVANGTAAGEGGGGIRVNNSGGTAAPLSVVNSTISRNTAYRDGGGLYLGTNTSAYLSSATVTANVANQSGGTGAGGGLYVQGTAYLGNTILAGNILRPGSAPVQLETSDVAGNLVSRGYNLIGVVNPTTSITGDSTGNHVGAVGAVLDVGLGPLSSGCSHVYIDSVPVHPLLSTSMAINAANPAGARHTNPYENRLLTVDQCGSPRAQQGRADIGAHESPYEAPEDPPPAGSVYLPLLRR